MNEDKKTEIKVGVTIFVALIIFGLIFSWAKNYSFSNNKYQLAVNFNTVAGLEKGDLVSVNGVRKGLVESIESSGNAAQVEIAFSENPNLKEDATFSIMMLDLMGGKKIEISSGISKVGIDFDKIYSGKFSGDISTAMSTLNSVESDLISVVKELKTSLEFVNKNFINDDFSTNINSSLLSLKSLTSNLNEIIISNKKNFKETFESTRELTSNMNEIVRENKTGIKDLLETVKFSIQNADSLISKIDIIVSETSSGENNLGKLLYDKNLFNDLKQSLEQINRLTKTLNNQLEHGGLEVKADVDLF